jgi:Xaa-Pro aminopeptidase
MATNEPDRDPYFIDFPARIRAIQAEMQREDLDVYLGSRLRTLSWTIDAFCPWRTFVVIPREGLPVVFTFAIDAARVGDDSWLDAERVRGFAPLDGMDQIDQISECMREMLDGRSGKLGIEDGMSNYLPEGNLTHYEYERLRAAFPAAELVNAHTLVDRLATIKDGGTINRFREASRIVDVGHEAVFEALRDGGYRGMTETEIAGIAAHAMRKAGSEWEWSFTGGNEIASGYRTGYASTTSLPPSPSGSAGTRRTSSTSPGSRSRPTGPGLPPLASPRRCWASQSRGGSRATFYRASSTESACSATSGASD